MTTDVNFAIPGEKLLEVSNAISALTREYYGRGPERSKAYVNDDVLVVVMRGGLTRVEQTLLAGGEGELVRQVRLTFQQLMAEPFKEAVSRIVERPVVAYMSQIIFETETLFEFFHLATDSDGPR